jgi:hypothetical protein
MKLARCDGWKLEKLGRRVNLSNGNISTIVQLIRAQQCLDFVVLVCQNNVTLYTCNTQLDYVSSKTVNKQQGSDHRTAA